MIQWLAKGRSVYRPLSVDELREMNANIEREIANTRNHLASLLKQQKELWDASAGVKVGDAIATRFGIQTVKEVDTSYAHDIGHKPAVRVEMIDGAVNLLKPNEWSMIGDQ